MVNLLEALQAQPFLWIGTATILGLLVGSFLNVVAWRLPLMMERHWRAQCRQMLDAEAPPAEPGERFDLLFPRSRCPHCGHAISAAENIPVLSWLLLRGRCRGCGERISLRYPIVELASGLLAALVAWRFGVTAEGAAAMGLVWTLLVLTLIDIDHQLLPDSITLPLLWTGLLLRLLGIGEVSLVDAVIGAMAGYLSLWSLFHLFRLLTGKEGMGYGDFKLLAALGAWMGWQSLLPIVLLSSLVGAVTGIALIVVADRDRSIPIPYGPYLAGAGLIYLLWGETIIGTYQRWAGLGP